MKLKLQITLLLLITALTATAQERRIQYKPYIDLRPLHFGILVGMNLQDIELQNVGPQTITLDDGTTVEKTIVCDDDRWNSGFSVGVLADLRLSQHLNLRFSPTMHFGAKRLAFLNMTDRTAEGRQVEATQHMDEQEPGVYPTETYRLLPGNRTGLRLLSALLQADTRTEVLLQFERRVRPWSCRRTEGCQHAYVHKCCDQWPQQDDCVDILFRMTISSRDSRSIFR